jgi:hypothetical protein
MQPNTETTRNSTLEPLTPGEATELWVQSCRDELAAATLKLQRFHVEQFTEWLQTEDINDMWDVTARTVGSVLERQPIHEDSVTVDDGALSVSMVMDVSDLAPEEKEKLASVVREQERRLQHLHGGLLSSGE